MEDAFSVPVILSWQNNCSMDVIHYLRSICVYILKLCLNEGIRGGNLVLKELKLFWMNDETVIEFGFRMT